MTVPGGYCVVAEPSEYGRSRPFPMLLRSTAVSSEKPGNRDLYLRDIKANDFFYSSALRSCAICGAFPEVKAALVGKRMTPCREADDGDS
ncbi:hypothetical protein D3C84_649310 [compost metagenome]